LVEVLGQADAKVVDRAIEATETLPQPTRCSGPQGLDPSLFPLREPEHAQDVAVLRERLAKSNALSLAGRYEEALQVAVEVRDETQRLGDAPLHAESAYEVGRMHEKLGRYGTARTIFEEVAWMAVEAHHRRLAAVAWLDLVFLEGVVLGDSEAAQRALRAANAEIKALGGDSALEQKLLVHSGTLAVTEERYEDALRAFDEALAVDALNRSPLKRADVLFNVASVEAATGQLDTALDHFREYIALYEGRLGELHPDVALGHYNLGATLHRMGRSAEALAELQHAASIERETLGEDHPRHVDTLAAIGMALADLERTEEAVAALQAAVEAGAARPEDASNIAMTHGIELASTLLDLDPPDLAGSAAWLGLAEDFAKHPAAQPGALTRWHHVMARLERIRGNSLEARAHAEATLAIEREHHVAGSESTAYALLLLAEIVEEQGDHREASRLVRELLADGNDGSDGERERSQGHMVLARSLWALGEREAARVHAGAARDAFERLGRTRQREQAETWLAAHVP
jgi:tetratricopeptide (TPR) repeat protein